MHPNRIPFFGGRIKSVVGGRFLSRLLAQPRGRAFMFAYMADAEKADEQGVFEALLQRVDDPRLHTLVRKHLDDETRHTAMLYEAVRRQGVIPEKVPEAMRIVPMLDRMLGGFSARFVDGKQGVMEAYVLLQVIEERAVLEWPNIVRALEKVDPASAANVASIVRDEAQHVKYARAISRKYAPDVARLERTLRHVREVEARTFEQHADAFLRFAVDNELLAVDGLEKRLWPAMARTTAQPALQISPLPA
jgi:demethoxyubiquinone hydroxylase (CLK1/Coq7/Cat5 family)